MRFEAPGLGLTIEITQTAIEQLTRHRQIEAADNESGGQLFARIDGNVDTWVIERATGPRIGDIRSRFGFKPNRRLEQNEIDAAFKDGLHFVGDWHTHPEPYPTPSFRDNKSMSEMYESSKHTLKGFIMIIVGNDRINNLWISIHCKSNTSERLVQRP